MAMSKPLVLSHPLMIAEFIRQSEFEGLMEQRFAVPPDLAALLFRNGELVDVYKGGHFSVGGLVNKVKSFVGGSSHIGMMIAELKPFTLETALQGISSDQIDIIGQVNIEMQVDPDKPENLLGMMHGVNRAPGQPDPDGKKGPKEAPPEVGRRALSKKDVLERLNPHLTERVFSQAIARMSAAEIRGNVGLQDKIQADIMKVSEEFLGRLGLIVTGASVQFARNTVEQENMKKAELERQVDMMEFQLGLAKRQIELQADAQEFQLEAGMNQARLQQASQEEIREMLLQGEVKFIDAREREARRQELEALNHEVELLNSETAAKHQHALSQMGHEVDMSQVQLKLVNVQTEIAMVKLQGETAMTKLVADTARAIEAEDWKLKAEKAREEDMRQRESLGFMHKLDQESEDNIVKRDISKGNAAAAWDAQSKMSDANAYATKASAIKGLDRDQIMALGASLSPDVAAVLVEEAKARALNANDAMARMEEMVRAAQAQNVTSSEQALEMLRITADSNARVAHGASGKGDTGAGASAPAGGSAGAPAAASAKTTVECPKCARVVPADYRFCPGCKTQLRT